ncbi:MAG: hypothetical protein HY046_07210 [Acidobacteria bacterium]|nr:hypothetical protein [Acidobacteriota bacterium]
MPGHLVCILCDQPPETCQCDKYCCVCHALEGIVFCSDGQYYCRDCREAMDIPTADTVGH